MKNLILIIVALAVAASPVAFASDSRSSHLCENALVGSGSVDEGLDAQFNSNLSQIEAQMSVATAADRKRAEDISEELLGEAKMPLDIRHAIDDHFTYASFFFAYSIVTIGISDKIVALIRDQGTVNYVTLHTSNFIEGIGYSGFFHQNLCAGALICSVAIQKSKANNWVQNKLRALRLRKGLSYQTQMLYLSALLFTFGNANSELKDLYHLSSAQNDWHDFMTGQMSLIPYYFLSKLIQRKGPAFLDEMRARGWLAPRRERGQNESPAAN